MTGYGATVSGGHTTFRVRVPLATLFASTGTLMLTAAEWEDPGLPGFSFRPRDERAYPAFAVDRAGRMVMLDAEQ